MLKLGRVNIRFAKCNDSCNVSNGQSTRTTNEKQNLNKNINQSGESALVG